MMYCKKGDFIYVNSDDNRYAHKTLICNEATSNFAKFVPIYDYSDIPITLYQSEESFNSIKAIKITKELHPEYFL